MRNSPKRNSPERNGMPPLDADQNTNKRRKKDGTPKSERQARPQAAQPPLESKKTSTPQEDPADLAAFLIPDFSAPDQSDLTASLMPDFSAFNQRENTFSSSSKTPRSKPTPPTPIRRTTPADTFWRDQASLHRFYDSEPKPEYQLTSGYNGALAKGNGFFIPKAQIENLKNGYDGLQITIPETAIKLALRKEDLELHQEQKHNAKVTVLIGPGFPKIAPTAHHVKIWVGKKYLKISPKCLISAATVGSGPGIEAGMVLRLGLYNDENIYSKENITALNKGVRLLPLQFHEFAAQAIDLDNRDSFYSGMLVDCAGIKIFEAGQTVRHQDYQTIANTSTKGKPQPNIPEQKDSSSTSKSSSYSNISHSIFSPNASSSRDTSSLSSSLLPYQDSGISQQDGQGTPQQYASFFSPQTGTTNTPLATVNENEALNSGSSYGTSPSIPKK